MSRLGRVLPLMDMETPHGYASRLATGYGLRGVEFCRDFGLSLQHLTDGRDDDMTGLEDLVGLSEGSLGRHAFRRVGDAAWMLRGQRIERPAMRRTRLRACPACLSDDIAGSTLPREQAAYVRAPWLLASIRTCPHHGIGLIQVASEDDRSVHDLAARVSSALGSLPDLARRAPRRPPSGLETYLLERLERGVGGSAWLDGLAFHVAGKACEMIGAVAAFGRTPDLKRFEDVQWYEAGAAGHAIAAGGEAAVRGFLSDLQGSYAYKAAGTEGPQVLFGRLYQWLAFSARSPDVEPVRALVRMHVVETMPVAAGEDVLGLPVERRRLHSIRSAALETGRHPKTIRRLLAEGGLIPADGGDRIDALTTFDADLAAPLLAKATGKMSLSTARGYLNAPRVDADMLLRSGFIVPIDASSAGMISAHPFERSELDRFLAELLAGAQPVDEAGSDMWSIPAAARRANCGAAEIVRLILDRKLLWVGRRASERGYMSVLVDAPEVKRLVRGPELDGKTESQLSEELKATWETVKALVAEGILKTKVVTHPIKRCPTRVVPFAEIEAFKSTYVSLFQLSADTGDHFRKIKKRLALAGVEPAFDPRRFHCTLYRRADLSR